MIEAKQEKTLVELKTNQIEQRGAEGKGAMKGGKEPLKQRASSVVLPATKRRVLLLKVLFDIKHDTSMHNLPTANNNNTKEFYRF